MKKKQVEKNPYICEKCGNVKVINFGSALATTAGGHKRCYCKPEKKKRFFRAMDLLKRWGNKRKIVAYTLSALLFIFAIFILIAGEDYFWLNLFSSVVLIFLGIYILYLEDFLEFI